jgi:seryl-tRNA synthetase
VSVGLQRLRDEPDAIRDGAVKKGEDPALVDRALELDAGRRRLLGDSETL